MGGSQGIVDQVLRDLGERGFIAAGASVVVLGLGLSWWAWWTSRIRRGRRDGIIAILVTGTRGKSSTVRLLHGALSAAGIPTYAKTTGTLAAELDTSGAEHRTRRIGRPSILEMLEALRRALRARPRPRVLVLECMAVSPELIDLLSREMVDPDIVVITNTVLDHLEEQGTTRARTAASLATAIRPGCLVVTAEADPEAVAILERETRRHHATWLPTAARLVPAADIIRLPGAHPQNIAITLAITRHLGIADDVALDGMAVATREPGDGEVWTRAIGPWEATYLDLGAINEPDSLMGALDRITWPVPEGTPRIGLVVGRWDRPFRAVQFAGALSPRDFDAILLAGGPVYSIRAALVDAGWARERIEIASPLLGWSSLARRRLATLARTVDPEAHRMMILALENEHDPIADRVRGFFRGGRQASDDRAIREAPDAPR